MSWLLQGVFGYTWPFSGQELSRRSHTEMYLWRKYWNVFVKEVIVVKSLWHAELCPFSGKVLLWCCHAVRVTSSFVRNFPRIDVCFRARSWRHNSTGQENGDNSVFRKDEIDREVSPYCDDTTPKHTNVSRSLHTSGCPVVTVYRQEQLFYSHQFLVCNISYKTDLNIFYTLLLSVCFYYQDLQSPKYIFMFLFSSKIICLS